MLSVPPPPVLSRALRTPKDCLACVLSGTARITPASSAARPTPAAESARPNPRQASRLQSSTAKRDLPCQLGALSVIRQIVVLRHDESSSSHCYASKDA